MNLMQRYQRNQSIINQSKNEDSSQSQIRKLYLSSIHKPFLNPLDPPAPSLNSNSNYSINSNNVLRTNSNFSKPIKIENLKPQNLNQCVASQNKSIQINQEKELPKKNEITDSGQNKLIQKIPICDFEKNKSTIYSKYSNDTFSGKRPNIELPQLERLPSIFRTNRSPTKEDEMKFKKILKLKFDLINTKLDFSNLEMDRPAKQIRLSAINEICQTFMGKNNTFDRENGEEQLLPNKNYEIYKMIFNFLSKLILRPTSDPFEKFMFSDDMTNISNMELGQLSLCYNALNFALKDSNLDQHSKSELFDRNFIQKLFQKFNVPDIGERSLLAQFVLDIVNFSNEDHSSFVLKKCYNELQMYNNGSYRLPYVLIPTLSILYNIYNGNVKTKNNKNDLSIYYNDYIQFILPVLGTLHFTSCTQQMAEIIELFISKGNDEIVFKTVKSLIKYFPLTKSSKTLIFLSILSTSLSTLSICNLRKVTRRLFSILSFCSSSPNIIISQTSSLLWSSPLIENLIVDNSKIILPLVYTELNDALSQSWSEEARIILQDILDRLKRIDSNLFNELDQISHQKVDNKSVNLTRASYNNMEKWKMIALEASRKDKSLDLKNKLFEIQNAFVVDPSLSKYEDAIQSNLSLPSVYTSSSTSSSSRNPDQSQNAGQSKNKFLFFFSWLKKRTKDKKK